jgi:NADH:ubiquinone oxidoreductase subunit 6 (subunit J)
LPIIAHFINNAVAVIYTFVMMKQGKSYQEIANQPLENWAFYVVSVVVVTTLFLRFYKLSKDKQSDLNPL